MGRVFTILFEFQNEQHVAMVTLSQDPKGAAAFNVQLFNHELYYLIQDGKFMFTPTDNWLPPSVQSRAATELFQSVKTAIYTYLSPPSIAADEKMLNEIKHDSNKNTQL